MSSILILILFSLVFIILLTVSIALAVFILFWLSKKFNLSQPTVKKSLYIVSIEFLLGILFIPFSLFIQSSWFSTSLSILLGFGIFYVLLYRMYRTSFVKTIGLYIAYSFLSMVLVFLLSTLIIVPIRMFFIQPFYAKGEAMEPVISEGNYLLIQKIDRTFRRNDIVVFQYSPDQKKRYLIKRIIGLPGETVEIKGKIIFINGIEMQNSFLLGDLRNGQKVELGKDEYFVLGDNLTVSLDSRVFGPVKKDHIVGSIILNTSTSKFSWMKIKE